MSFLEGSTDTGKGVLSAEVSCCLCASIARIEGNEKSATAIRTAGITMGAVERMKKLARVFFLRRCGLSS